MDLSPLFRFVQLVSIPVTGMGRRKPGLRLQCILSLDGTLAGRQVQEVIEACIEGEWPGHAAGMKIEPQVDAEE